MTARRRLIVASLLLAGGCSGGGGGAVDAAGDGAPVVDAAPDAAIDAAIDGPGGSVDHTTPTLALSDLLVDTYKGFEGGLYPGRSNMPPPAHLGAGRMRAAAIEPREVMGDPAAAGKYVLLSVGMSNTTQEWCAGGGGPPCVRQSFMFKAAADPAVEHQALAIVNGARGGQGCSTWDQPSDPNWDRVRDVLRGQGLSEAQVQILWLKCAEPQPTMALPAAMSHAYFVERALGGIVRTARARYPNLQQVFISNRIYAGFATTALNPEPHAYETGFAVKWAVEAQIRQRATGTIDPEAGDLGPAVAPWIGWAADLWANGTTARSDGLTYVPGDFANDGTHPGQLGVDKVSTLLLAFFKTSPLTRCWFLAGQTCPAP